MFDPHLNDLIGGIYDAVIDPQRWTEAIDRIRRDYSFRIAIMSANRLPDGSPTAEVAANVPLEFLENLGRFGTQNLDVWGGPARLFSLPLEEPIVMSQVVEMDKLPDNEWVREWSRPQGLVDQLGIVIEHNRRMLATVGFGLDESAPPISEATVDDMRIIAPHLRRAVTIAGLLDEARAAAASFEATLDATSSAVILVGADLRIVHAYAMATAMLDRRDPILENAGRLEFAQAVAPGKLEAAVRATADADIAMTQSGVGIPARRGDGSTIVAHVLPLKFRAPLRAGLRQTAVAAVLVAEPGREPNLPVDALTALYNLRPSELRIFEMIVRGRSSREMAIAVGVKPSTIKTHVQSLYDKTGRHNRVGLVALAREVGAFV